MQFKPSTEDTFNLFEWGERGMILGKISISTGELVLVSEWDIDGDVLPANFRVFRASEDAEGDDAYEISDPMQRPAATELFCRLALEDVAARVL